LKDKLTTDTGDTMSDFLPRGVNSGAGIEKAGISDTKLD